MITYDFDLKIFTSSLINDDKFFSGFSTKSLGDAKYHVENIFKFFDSNSIKYKKIVIPEQIHSINVEIFSSNKNENLEKMEEVDGVITKEEGAVLTVVTADCSPLVFVDKERGIIAVSHQGWRGSVKRMAQKIVEKMIDSGADINSIKVAIGPAIGECCYDIDDDRYFEFREEFDGYTEKIFHHRGGKWHLNLSLLNYLLLVEKGVKKENIDFFPFCTKCDKEHFFSFRRDKRSDFGEMFSFIIKTL
ncbi:peptidoglycan editing factor PgeF [Candidatus Roizmanbacteria bacterium]|nr:peptidoglycan editing factor PgeF [Candidatus Roizmanbacteria bacterium]